MFYCLIWVIILNNPLFYSFFLTELFSTLLVWRLRVLIESSFNLLIYPFPWSAWHFHQRILGGKNTLHKSSFSSISFWYRNYLLFQSLSGYILHWHFDTIFLKYCINYEMVGNIPPHSHFPFLLFQVLGAMIGLCRRYWIRQYIPIIFNQQSFSILAFLYFC